MHQCLIYIKIYGVPNLWFQCWCRYDNCADIVGFTYRDVTVPKSVEWLCWPLSCAIGSTDGGLYRCVCWRPRVILRMPLVYWLSLHRSFALSRARMCGVVHNEWYDISWRMDCRSRMISMDYKGVNIVLSVFRPRHYSDASFKTECMMSITDIQSCSDIFGSPNIDRTAASMSQIRRSIVPLNQDG